MKLKKIEEEKNDFWRQSKVTHLKPAKIVKAVIDNPAIEA